MGLIDLLRLLKGTNVNIGDRIYFVGDKTPSTLVEIHTTPKMFNIYRFSNPQYDDDFSFTENEIKRNRRQYDASEQ